MATPGIPAKLRNRVRKRAANRCEYCGYPQAFCGQPFHCDHVFPTSMEGLTEFGNVVWACPNCNGSKRERIDAFDGVTKQIVALFNPRKDRWEEHFRWSRDRLSIRGKTPTGRATVRLLRMNRKGMRLVRQYLLHLGIHPDQ
jgi:5-methylcytosine-specific restriction endonuclease McrA